MDSKFLDGLLEAPKRLQRAAIGDARAGRDSGAAASLDTGDLVLAELRLRRDRLKHLIRLLSEEARLEEGAGHAPCCASRHRCRGLSSGSPARAA
jgi:hypothetical protein